MDYFAANDIAAFSVLSGTPTEVTTAGFFDPTYTAKGISPAGGALLAAPFMNPTTGVTTSLTDVWFHASFFTANNGGVITLIEFLDSAGTPVVRFVSSTNVTFRIDYWNGAAWVAGATTFNAGSALVNLDIHIVCGVSGSLNVYFNNNLQLTTTGLNAAVDNIQQFRFGNATSAVPANYTFSQILVSDANTIGAKVGSLTPTGNSATNTAWANDFNNIVKTGFNDATLISSTTLGDNESYTKAAVALPTAQYSVSSVWFAIRARLNSATPANIKPLLRIGGTNYAGAYNFANLDAISFKPSLAAFVNDPSTSAAWAGVANVNAAEVGVQTAA